MENSLAPKWPRLELCQCPFCGSLQLVLRYAPNGGLQVLCVKCHAQGPSKDEPARAVVAWNRAWNWQDVQADGVVHARSYKLGLASKLIKCNGTWAKFHPAPPEAFTTGWTKNKPEEDK